MVGYSDFIVFTHFENIII